jgi:hypothetical protein
MGRLGKHRKQKNVTPWKGLKTEIVDDSFKFEDEKLPQVFQNFNIY